MDHALWEVHCSFIMTHDDQMYSSHLACGVAVAVAIPSNCRLAGRVRQHACGSCKLLPAVSTSHRGKCLFWMSG